MYTIRIKFAYEGATYKATARLSDSLEATGGKLNENVDNVENYREEQTAITWAFDEFVAELHLTTADGNLSPSHLIIAEYGCDTYNEEQGKEDFECKITRQ